jgi:hypothetical protein
MILGLSDIVTAMRAIDTAFQTEYKKEILINIPPFFCINIRVGQIRLHILLWLERAESDKI